MKISKSSSNSISLLFNNLEIDLCYPLIRLDCTYIAFKLDTELSYYKFDNKEYNYPTNPLLQFGSNLDYVFTVLILGFGFIVTYTIKENEH